MWSLHRLLSYDGTDLAYYRAGRRSGPTLVLCNGLGGNMVVWRSLLRRFSGRYRILGWDYRGLYASGPARQPDAYGIDHHARDLLHLLDHEHVHDPILVGWSMGTQVSLELHRLAPDRPRALIAIHGTQGQALSTAFDSPVTERIAPTIFAAMRLLGRRIERVGPPLARSPAVMESLVWAWQRLGVMAPSLDTETFSQLAEQWLQLDFAVYAEIFQRLHAHDARDLLPEIDTPTLILAGSADAFTPAHLAERMASEMPNAVLQTIEGATHFGLLEFPEAIGDAIDDYLMQSAGVLER